MNTAEISSDIVEVLSRITGQKLNQRDVTPTLLFATNLITVLLGVILADGEVSTEEKQQFQQTLNLFIPPQGNMRQLVQLLGKGVKQNKVYTKTKVLKALSESLSEPEKLLLLGLGYEMSAADGSIDAKEKRYLDAIASKVFQLNPRYGTVFETALTQPEKVDAIALMELEFLLNPGRFQNLDLAFIEAASQLLERLQAAEKPQETLTPETPQTSESVAYESLRQFQAQKRNLDEICLKLCQVLQDCVDQSFIPTTLIQDLGKISQKLQSQSFRVAVVGEFSKGKSTLLNALLGEEIQPTRAIPCSGTVTILRYGTQKRVICCYDDGHEEIISSELYKEKAAIPRQEARERASLTKQLSQSDLAEIIFEHPGLALCKNGVEIIDSPGLNEHPARTAITQKLISGTDAIIFLTHANNVLTQTEQELLNSLQNSLNNGKQSEPVSNLFIVVNCIDLIRLEEDREDIEHRVNNIVLGKSPIIRGENRIHYISAQSALDAIQKDDDNEYLATFKQFYQAVESFLIQERGQIEIRKSLADIKTCIQSSCEGLEQYREVLEGKVKLSEESKTQIINQIGEISGRQTHLMQILYQITNRSFADMIMSWNNHFKNIDERLIEKSSNWYCQAEDKEKIIEFYSNCFVDDLSQEIDDWIKNNLQSGILKQNIFELYKILDNSLREIQTNLINLDTTIGSNLNEQFEFSKTNLNKNLNLNDLLGNKENEDGLGFLGNLAISLGSVVTNTLLGFTGLGLLPIALIGLATAAGIFFLFSPDWNQIRDELKQKVLEERFKQFSDSEQEIFDAISERVNEIFDDIAVEIETIMSQAMFLCESLIEQHEKVQQENQAQCEIEKVTISLKRQEIEEIQEELNSII